MTSLHERQLAEGFLLNNFTGKEGGREREREGEGEGGEDEILEFFVIRLIEIILLFLLFIFLFSYFLFFFYFQNMNFPITFVKWKSKHLEDLLRFRFFPLSPSSLSPLPHPSVPQGKRICRRINIYDEG